MAIKITPFTPSGEITAPPSKSVAHRLLISAALKKGKTVIKNVGSSADVIATVNCLRALGAQIDLLGEDALVEGIKTVKKGSALDCGESGSTLRFLMPVSSAIGANSTFTGSDKLLSRPSKVLIDQLKTHGVSVDGLSFSGKMQSGEYKIDCSLSSQYATGLLFALPLLNGNSTLEILGEEVSKDYINITLSVLEKSGIDYEKCGNKFVIRGNQEYSLPDEVAVEGDWSGAAYPLVLGAIGGEVKVKGLNANSPQGDKRILEILKKAGAEVVVTDEYVCVKKNCLRGFSENFEDIPDLAPVCAGLASVCKGESRLTGLSRLKIKESDRIKTTVEVLKTAGVKVEEGQSCLKIYGGEVKGGNFKCENDHRIVMLAFVLSAVANVGSTVENCSAVNKSYPEFFKDYRLLGGKVDGDF